MNKDEALGVVKNYRREFQVNSNGRTRAKQLLCPSKGKNSRHCISRHWKGLFSSHLSKIPANLWDLRVVSKQAGRLNERFAPLAFISVVSQPLLWKRLS